MRDESSTPVFPCAPVLADVARDMNIQKNQDHPMKLPQPHHLLRQSLATTIAGLAAIVTFGTIHAATYYVATTGSDSNSGSSTAPFASLMKAQSVAASGDTVYIRGGTYKTFTIASSDTTYSYVHKFTKSGIKYIAYPGETPVFDFSAISASKRVCAFLLTASTDTFQDFNVIGIQVGSQEQSECFRINSGDGNVIRHIKIHDCPAIGVYIQKTASHTLVENCDAYNLVGVSGVSAGNIDGFGCHSSGVGNTFRGCRSWHNSDDGYDCINAAASVTFDHCWAYNNGVNGGNGNGFKVGGWGSQPQNAIPNPVPVHTVTYCLSAENKANGFYANHQPGQAANWTNNTSYNNAGADFNMLERTAPNYSSTSPQTSSNDIAGVKEVMHNNLAYLGTLVSNLNESGTIVSNNSWTKSVTVSSADFQSTDATQIMNGRHSDGSLPTITFLHLASGSDLTGLGCF